MIGPEEVESDLVELSCWAGEIQDKHVSVMVLVVLFAQVLLYLYEEYSVRVTVHMPRRLSDTLQALDSDGFVTRVRPTNRSLQTVSKGIPQP